MALHRALMSLFHANPMAMTIQRRSKGSLVVS